MNPSKHCYEVIKQFEGCKLHAYPDPASGGDPWTIGYGSTLGVKRGMVITQDQAEQRLIRDVDVVAKSVNEHVSSVLTQNQFDAVCSFVFNIGITRFLSSTMLKKLNASDFRGAANEFPRWDMANGAHEKGIHNRRMKEKALFLEGMA